MIKLFGSAGPDHPMADAKEAKRILDERGEDYEIGRFREMVREA